jgi:hypothetical protein
MPKKELKLKSCPFCGGNNLYIVNVQGCLDSTVGVFCNWCKVTLLHEDNEDEGDTLDTRRRAVIAWNRRVKDAE